MLRLALVLALVAGLIALVVNFAVTKPAIEAQTEDLTKTKADLASTTVAKDTAVAEAKVSKANADKSAKELSETKVSLETAGAEAAMQKTRADKLTTDLSKASKDRNEAQQELARWQVLNVQPEQVAKLQTDLKDATEAKAVLGEEKKIFIRNVANLQARLDRYENPEDRPVEMPGLKGSVLAVDTKWDFVLLDIGEDQGAKERGVLLVRRGDKLVGKARIVTVERNRCIANLMPSWKQGDIVVAAGDNVLY